MKISSQLTLLALGLLSALPVQAGDSLIRITCFEEATGSEIYINGKFKGECPLDVGVQEGPQKVRVVKKVDANFERVFEQEVRMGDGVVKKLEVKLGESQLTAAGKKRVQAGDAAVIEAVKKRGAAEEAAKADADSLHLAAERQRIAERKKQQEDEKTATSLVTGSGMSATKPVSSFTQALRCMDQLFIVNGRPGIRITSVGLTDETGRVRNGTKEMIITAITKMTLQSNAFEFFDFVGVPDLVGRINKEGPEKLPSYVISGSLRGVGGPRSDNYGIEMVVMEAATQKRLSATSTSNTIIISDGVAKISSGRFSFSMTSAQGVGVLMRAALELGLIETLGKLTNLPYENCLN